METIVISTIIGLPLESRYQHFIYSPRLQKVSLFFMSKHLIFDKVYIKILEILVCSKKNESHHPSGDIKW
jgi:hypothetical protein